MSTYYRVVAVQSSGGEELINSFGLFESANYPHDLQGHTDIFANAWATHLAPLLSDQWSLIEFRWYDQAESPGTPPKVLAPTGGPVVGQGTSNLLPLTSSVLVSYTTFNGPPHRGRTYLGGWAEASNSGGAYVELNAVTAAANWANAIKDAFTALPVTVRWGVLRPVGPKDEPLAFASIQNIKVTNTWATQRRRSRRN